MAAMKVRKYYVVGRRQLTLQEEEVAEPGPGQVLIRTHVSALSVGTQVWRWGRQPLPLQQRR